MYLVKTPEFVRRSFPQFTWSLPPGKKTIFLTFDDGPHPEITPEVLRILNSFQARATFFLQGQNVLRHPECLDRIRKENHICGSHTFHHLNGWRTNNNEYLKDVFKAADLIGSTLFRPPYGRIKPSQIRSVSTRLHIIMWSVLSGDFDPGISPEKCLNNMLRHTTDGSVVVMHDTEKAADRMLYALPRFLEHFSEKGYSFHPLTSALLKSTNPL